MKSASKEDYLRGIYHLMEDNKEVKSVELADYLNITKPSVSQMLQELDKEGLIEYKKYSKLKFTAKGHNIAKKLTFKHRIIETFLKDTLKIRSNDIHEEAHRLEHAFSDKSIDKLRKLLGNPKLDPHGKPIPLVG
ncbi:MAG: metal-dependent transcriptional regulator [Candidatus Woesearchaeota archaeon]|jgi:DtxR family Mn-dependent transcriptional regulator|nr:metal-dependent transcriptional regulator [Candidatus Woesearchaeota archaeon]|tara:strand:- start:6340 stop:6744 length:405 start_codon:yes stop_codon:yes gene_type:complete